MTVENITVFPVVLKEKVNVDADYITLDEGTEKKLVVVSEKGADIENAGNINQGNTNSNVQMNQVQQQYNSSQGEVNEVQVSNLSDQTLFVMAGEIILGGKQDRVVQKDVIIPPRTKNFPVAVFCVEHGRWSGESMSFESSKNLTQMKLRKKAMFTNQQEVWNEVAEQNKKQQTETETGTYRAVIKNEKVAKEMEPHVQAINKFLAGMDNLTGVVVAIDGKVVAIDVFFTPKMFTQVRDKIIKSYVLEAMTREKPVKKAATLAEAEKFIANAENAQAKMNRENVSAKLKGYNFDSESIEGEMIQHDGKDLHYNIYTK
jgi:hypothetical protein